MTRVEHAALIKACQGACNAIQRAMNKARALNLPNVEALLSRAKTEAIEAYGTAQAGGAHKGYDPGRPLHRDSEGNIWPYKPSI